MSLTPTRSTPVYSWAMSAAVSLPADIISRARLLLANLGVEQITDDALGLMLAFDGGSHDLIVSRLHAVELELAHEVEELTSFHQMVLLRLS